tara:strand:+ start:686 stop:2521 length:1836 start_codon:yes stop_codon:yes gene_type:complete
MFNEVLAIDVLTDLSYYTQDVLKLLVPEIHPDDRHNFCDVPADQDPNDLENAVYYLRAPRNTILGIDFEETQEIPVEFLKPGEALLQIILADKKNVAKFKVYYPFFSSHLCLPVKPGESVWTFEANGVNYWITRVSQALPVEDPNFTHRDRKWSPVRQLPIKVTQGEAGYQDFKAPDGEDLELESQPSFPLGPGFSVRDSNRKEKIEELAEETEKLENDRTVEPVLSNTVFLADNLTFFMLPPDSEIETRSVYDFYYKTNKDRNAIAYEPVPRLNKRPGDLVIQGSNNSSIVLGTERADTWRLDNIPDGTKTNVLPIPLDDDTDPTPLEGKRGIIDIVAGRGRIDQDYSSDNIKDQDPAGTTRPRVIQNTREEFETHKNLGLDKNIMSAVPPDPDSGHLYDVPEGDPDFLHDASRVYVSMKSNPDVLLYGELVDDDPYPLTPKVGESNDGEALDLVEDAASIIVKSDEVRIVARYREQDDPVTGSPPINGSIRLIKEGVADSRDGDGSAFMMMLPDGTVMIDGPKIVLGSGSHAEDDGHGGGQQLSLGVGATEPMVLGNELKTKLEALIDEIKLITVPTPAGPSGMPNNGAAFDAIKNDLSCILSKLGKTL